MAEDPTEVFMQRIDKDGLDRLFTPVLDVVLTATLGGAEPCPVCGLVAGAGVGRLHKGFRQYGPVCIDALPVFEQQAQVAAQQMRSQVRYGNERKHEEPGVVDDPEQVLSAHCRGPSNVTVTAGNHPGSRPPAQACDRSAIGQGQVLEMLSDRLTVSQVMVGGDQMVEQCFGFAGATNLNPLNGQQLLKRPNDGRCIHVETLGPGLSPGIDARTPGRRKPDVSTPFKLEEQSPADHVLQMPIGLPPVPLTAKLFGNNRTASIPLGVHNVLDEGDLVGSDTASAVCEDGVHGPVYSRSEKGTPEGFSIFLKVSLRQTRQGSFLLKWAGIR